MLARLPGALGEAWFFESPLVENADSWRSSASNTPALDRLIAKHASGRKRGGHPPVSREKKRADSSVLRHIMAASDPVTAVTGGTDWRAEAALREFASRTGTVSDSAISAAVLDDPLSVGGEAAFREVCTAVGVGLIVQTDGFKVVKLCGEKNVWLTRSGLSGSSHWSSVDWCKEPVSDDRARALMADKGRARAADASVGIKELRSIAEACGIPRPLPRSKQALSDLILRDVG